MSDIPPDILAIREAHDILADQLAAMDDDCGDPQCDECGVRRRLARVVEGLRRRGWSSMMGRVGS